MTQHTKEQYSKDCLKLKNYFTKGDKELVNSIKLIRNENNSLKIFINNGNAGWSTIDLSSDNVNILKKWLTEVG